MVAYPCSSRSAVFSSTKGRSRTALTLSHGFLSLCVTGEGLNTTEKAEETSPEEFVLFVVSSVSC